MAESQCVPFLSAHQVEHALAGIIAYYACSVHYNGIQIRVWQNELANFFLLSLEFSIISGCLRLKSLSAYMLV